MRKRIACVFAIVVVLGTLVAAGLWLGRRSPGPEEVLSAYRQNPGAGGVQMVYPQDGTLFPPGTVPPVFRWGDANSRAGSWASGPEGRSASFRRRPSAFAHPRMRSGRRCSIAR